MTGQTSALALDPESMDPDGADARRQYLTFRIADETYGIPIETVAEIVGLQKITSVPDARPYVKGVINLRGTVIPVIDVRVRLAMEPLRIDERTCIVVVQLERTLVGLLVDRIAEVIDVDPEKIEPATRRRAGFAVETIVTGFIQTGGDVKILIDLARLLEDATASGEGAAERKA